MAHGPVAYVVNGKTDTVTPRGEGDFLAGEVFELADEVTLAAAFVDGRFVVAGPDVVVAGLGSDIRCQMIVSMELPVEDPASPG